MTATAAAVEYRQSWNPTERDFQQQLVTAARTLGWTVYHTFDSRRSDKGFPDLVLVKPGRLIIWELKTNKGRVRPEQLQWMALFETVPGVTCGIVRPQMWDHCLAILSEQEDAPGSP